MTPLAWTGVVGGSFAAGAALAGLLVVPRRREPLTLAGIAVGLAVAVTASGAITAILGTPLAAVVAGLVSLGGSVGGYALVSALLSGVRHRCDLPTVPPPRPGSDTLVALLVDLEPESYAPGDVTRRISELTDTGLPDPALAVLPFFYAGHKARYRAVGGVNPEGAQAAALGERLETLLEGERVTGPVVAPCPDGDVLAGIVAAAGAAGFGRVVLASPYVAEPRRIAAAKRSLAEARHGSRSGEAAPEVLHTRTLWTSAAIADAVAERTWAAARDATAPGVALVMHGRPGPAGHGSDAFAEQENSFANRVRTAVAERGVESERIRLCWDSWQTPDVTETVRHLAMTGCDRIIVAPVTYPFTNLDTLVELPAAARQARVDDDVPVVHLDPWQDEPVVAEEIATAIVRAIRDSDAL